MIKRALLPAVSCVARSECQSHMYEATEIFIQTFWQCSFVLRHRHCKNWQKWCWREQKTRPIRQMFRAKLQRSGAQKKRTVRSYLTLRHSKPCRFLNTQRGRDWSRSRPHFLTTVDTVLICTRGKLAVKSVQSVCSSIRDQSQTLFVDQFSLQTDKLTMAIFHSS